MAQRLYHMVPVAMWRSCVESGRAYYPPTYEQDGFIHLTADPALLLTVANHFYTSSEGDWAVLVLDSTKLSAEVKFEPAAPVGEKTSQGLFSDAEQQQDGQQGHEEHMEEAGAAAAAADPPLFPHLYGSIDFEAVVGELPMQRSADGGFLGIDGVQPADGPFSEFT